MGLDPNLVDSDNEKKGTITLYFEYKEQQKKWLTLFEVATGAYRIKEYYKHEKRLEKKRR